MKNLGMQHIFSEEKNIAAITISLFFPLFIFTQKCHVLYHGKATTDCIWIFPYHQQGHQIKETADTRSKKNHDL